MTNPLLDGYIDRPSLAKALGLCEHTITRYERGADGLPSLKLGNRKLYRLDAVRRWLEARETGRRT